MIHTKKHVQFIIEHCYGKSNYFVKHLLYMLTLHAHTNIPLSSARLPTFFQRPPRKSLSFELLYQTGYYLTNHLKLATYFGLSTNFEISSNPTLFILALNFKKIISAHFDSTFNHGKQKPE